MAVKWNSVGSTCQLSRDAPVYSQRWSAKCIASGRGKSRQPSTYGLGPMLATFLRLYNVLSGAMQHDGQVRCSNGIALSWAVTTVSPTSFCWRKSSGRWPGELCPDMFKSLFITLKRHMKRPTYDVTRTCYTPKGK